MLQLDNHCCNYGAFGAVGPIEHIGQSGQSGKWTNWTNQATGNLEQPCIRVEATVQGAQLTGLACCELDFQ